MAQVNTVNSDNAFNVLKCANCGSIGHYYKNCNKPITSFGIILFKIIRNVNNQPEPQYLMVQRKDSLSYVEFIRGKYSIDQKTYLLNLFSNMTSSERNNIITHNFDTLWKMLWQSKDCRCYIREYNYSKVKFELLKSGYYIHTEHDAKVIFFNLEYCVKQTPCLLKESEWGFPKGRRNINEPDFICAMREFREETGINHQNIYCLPNIKPFEEVFSGTNKVRYKHIYYIASTNGKIGFGRKNKDSKEIKDVRWFTYEDAQNKIQDRNIERKELFKRVNTLVNKITANNKISFPTYQNFIA